MLQSPVASDAAFLGASIAHHRDFERSLVDYSGMERRSSVCVGVLHVVESPHGGSLPQMRESAFDRSQGIDIQPIQVAWSLKIAQI
jgi:hypothetical protein